MNNDLKQESEKLAQSWMRHDQSMLRDYLIADVEDPRINAQSILTRHFLVSAVLADKFDDLAQAEFLFSATMNWLLTAAQKAGHPEILADLDYALKRGADQAEGIDIPGFVREPYPQLPANVAGNTIPNYISQFLNETRYEARKPIFPQPVLETFQQLWATALSSATPLRVLEPACGSANDFRFLERFGLTRFLDYTGFDICEKNILNARELHPQIRFEVGNVFEIQAPDATFDSSFTHDLFEHLSPVGIDTAVAELCRVTRRSLCLHFFNMDEIPEDRVTPFEDYHWNTLSMKRMRERLAHHGFSAQVINISQYLRARTGSEEFHNPMAYTFLALRNE